MNQKMNNIIAAEVGEDDVQASSPDLKNWQSTDYYCPPSPTT